MIELSPSWPMTKPTSTMPTDEARPVTTDPASSTGIPAMIQGLRLPRRAVVWSLRTPMTTPATMLTSVPTPTTRPRLLVLPSGSMSSSRIARETSSGVITARYRPR